GRATDLLPRDDVVRLPSPFAAPAPLAARFAELFRAADFVSLGVRAAGAATAIGTVEPFFLRRHASNAANGWVFSTSRFVSPARRAWNTPNGRKPRSFVEWASVSIVKRMPRACASRALTSDKSRRSGWALISIATPHSAARVNTRSQSASAGSRAPILRPLG